MRNLTPSFFFPILYSVTERIPLVIIQELQKFRLRKLLKIVRLIPFWKDRLDFIPQERAITFFSSIKPATRSDFKKAGHSCLNSRLPKSRFVRGTTSGSTGTPFVFYRDGWENQESRAKFQRALNWMGWKPSDLIIRTFSSQKPMGCNEIVFNHDNPSELEKTRFELYRLMNCSQQIILYSFPSFIVPLARYWKRERPRAKIKSIFLVGEHLTAAARRYLETIFEANIYMGYACREMGIIAHECEQKSGMHIVSENLLLEVVDSGGNSQPHGLSGKILLSSFSNFAMPFIRYDIGDQGKVLKNPCVCGRTLPRIEIDGRQLAILPLSSKEFLYLVEVQRMIIEVASDSIEEFQLYQPTLGELFLFIVPAKNFKNETLIQLQKNLVDLTKGVVIIKIETVSVIPYRKSHKQAFCSEVLSDPNELFLLE